MSRVIKIDKNGSMTLSNVRIPGQITNLSIQGKMIIDKAQTEGSSGKKKVFSGYDDSAIAIKLLLLEKESGEMDRYKFLGVINKAFKGISEGSPTVFSVQGDMFRSLNIKHVLFQDLSAEESNEDDSISVSLNFTEHDPIISLVQEQQNTSSSDDNKKVLTPEGKIPEGISKKEYMEYKKLEAQNG